MIGSFIKFLFRLAFYVIIFFGAVWLFLGIPPNETYARAHQQINRMLGRANTVTANTQTTMSQMGQEYKTQYQHASDRFHGKDPYEGLANRFDSAVSGGGVEVNLKGH